MLNVSTLEVSPVNWGEYPPLFSTPTVDIMQLVFWSSMLNQWIKMVANHTGQPGALELTLGDLGILGQHMRSGLALPDAVAALLRGRA